MTDSGVERGSSEREAWRRSARIAARAWSEWSAADDRLRPLLYRRYVCALAEEERAAHELERALGPGAPQRHVNDRPAGAGGDGAAVPDQEGATFDCQG